MATVSKSKKSNQSTLLQGQLDDNQRAINSRNCKSSRISSIAIKKPDSNNNADSDNKANKKSRRQSDSGHSNDEDNDEESSNNSSAFKRRRSTPSNEENEHHSLDKPLENFSEIEGVKAINPLMNHLSMRMEIDSLKMKTKEILTTITKSRIIRGWY
jgi:G3E family GTPase